VGEDALKRLLLLTEPVKTGDHGEVLARVKTLLFTEFPSCLDQAEDLLNSAVADALTSLGREGTRWDGRSSLTQWFLGIVRHRARDELRRRRYARQPALSSGLLDWRHGHSGSDEADLLSAHDFVRRHLVKHSPQEVQEFYRARFVAAISHDHGEQMAAVMRARCLTERAYKKYDQQLRRVTRDIRSQMGNPFEADVRSSWGQPIAREE
jgi:DNA-directed RNA polymerase specialized sigma24 family protein